MMSAETDRSGRSSPGWEMPDEHCVRWSVRSSAQAPGQARRSLSEGWKKGSSRLTRWHLTTPTACPGSRPMERRGASRGRSRPGGSLSRKGDYAHRLREELGDAGAIGKPSSHLTHRQRWWHTHPRT